MSPLLELLLASGIVALGSLLQAASGLGAGLIVVPLLSMLSVDWVPGPCVAASLLLSWLMFWQGRQVVVHRHLGAMLGGLAAGIAIAASLLRQLPLDALGLVFGGLIVLAVLISLTPVRLPITRLSAGLTGISAGLIGTLAGIGAPILALFYQHERGPALRATLGLLYFLSSLVMLAALHSVGRFGSLEVGRSLQLFPGVMLGYWVSPRLAHWLDRGYSQIAVLAIALLSSTVLIGQSLLKLQF